MSFEELPIIENMGRIERFKTNKKNTFAYAYGFDNTEFYFDDLEVREKEIAFTINGYPSLTVENKQFNDFEMDVFKRLEKKLREFF